MQILIEADEKALAAIDEAFGSTERPEHFTNSAHCCECAEHDVLLRSRTRETLKIEDVGNPGWDPICFTSPQGIAYFFPALARLALVDPTNAQGWYGDQLLFHLYSGYKENCFYQFCNERQRAAVAEFLAHIIESRTNLIEEYADTDEFLRCHALWNDSQPGGGTQSAL
jgi:hypothetical protein